MDWDGKHLGVLVIGFPVRNMSGAQAGQTSASTRSGIWLSDRLYIDGLSVPDRHLVASRISGAMIGKNAGFTPVNLQSGPHLLFYKALDPKTQLAPAYR